jgi:hypothetical protein
MFMRGKKEEEMEKWREGKMAEDKQTQKMMQMR